MARPTAVHVEPTSTLDLFPLRVARQEHEILLGRHGARSYLAVDDKAFDAVMLLSRGVAPGAVKAHLAPDGNPDSVSIAPLLEQLLDAGFVRRIDGTQVEPDPRPRRRPWLTERRVAPLFGRPALVVYAAMLAAGVAALADPHHWPSASLVLGGQGYDMLLTTLGVVAAMTAKHEFAHIAAARYLGVDARWRFGHRLFFPVVETDLSDLWTVAPARRWIAYAAGVVSDLLAGAFALTVLAADARGWIAITSGAERISTLVVLVALVAVGWQANVFLRTDGYYLLTTALGERNLAADAKRWLRRPGRRTSRTIKLFAIGYVVTVALLSVAWAVGLYIAWAEGSGRGSVATGLAVGAVLLATGMALERRRAAARWRLVCPTGLLALLALLPAVVAAGR